MKSLAELRVEMDEIDRQLTGWFVSRMKCAQAIAAVKRASPEKGAVRQPQREAEILEKRAALSEGYAPYAKVLFCTLMDLSRALQYKLLEPCPEALRGATKMAFRIPRKSDELRRALTQVAAHGLTVESVSAAPSAENADETEVCLQLTPPQTADEAEALNQLLGALNAEYAVRRIA